MKQKVPLSFDLEKWERQFPIETFAWDALISYQGPAFVAYVEQFRRLAGVSARDESAVETDVHVLAYGEPNRRDCTKMGGLPYRPKDLAWPTAKETGKPLTFVAQFRLSESSDLVGTTPGDILLVFLADIAGAPYDWFPGPPHYEWHHCGLKSLIEAAAVPKTDMFVPTCFGVKYRTVDFDSRSVAGKIRQHLPATLAGSAPFPSWAADLAESCRVWNMLKIGGIPAQWTKQDLKAAGVAKARFLCSIPCVLGNSEGEFPWINSRTEVCHQSLIWTDSTTFQFFIDDDGKVLQRIAFH